MMTQAQTIDQTQTDTPATATEGHEAGAQITPNPKPPAATAESSVDEQLRSAYRQLAGTGGDASASAATAPPRAAMGQEGRSNGGDTPAGTDAQQPGMDAEPGTAQAGGEPAAGHAPGPPGPELAQAKELLGTFSQFGKKTIEGLSPEAALDAARQRAIQSLKLWQWPDDMLEKLPDSVLLNKGLAARKAQLAQSRMIEERRRFESQLDEVLKERQNQGRDPDRTAAADGSPPSEPGQLDQSLTQILDAVKNDGYFSELHPTLHKAFEAVSQQHHASLQQLQQQIATQQEQYNSLLDHTYQQLDQVLFDRAADGLVVDIPQLSDPDNRAKVFKQARSLGNLKGYYDDEDGRVRWRELTEHAARIVFGKEIQQQHQRQLTRRYYEQTSGQPSPAAGQPKRSTPMTPEQQQKWAMDQLRKGKSPDEVDRMLAAAGVGDR